MKKIVLLAAIMLTFGTIANAQMIGATNSNPTVRTDNSPLYHPTGPALRFSVGYPYFFTVAYSYHISSSLMVGGGTGFGMCNGTSSFGWSDKPTNSYTYSITNSKRDRINGKCLPLFMEAELHTPRYKWSLFINVKAGYNLFRPKDTYDVSNRMGDGSYAGFTRVYYSEKKYDIFFFTASVGASYKNLSLGLGYSTADYINVYLNYNLPLSSISRALF